MTTVAREEVVYIGRPRNLAVEDGFACVQRNDGVYLKTRLNTIDHSPAGFSWGYAGSGPSQLAVALLWDTLEDRVSKGAAKQFAIRYYMRFKFEVLCWIPYKSFELSQEYIWQWLLDILRTNELLNEDSEWTLADNEGIQAYFANAELKYSDLYGDICKDRGTFS